MKLDELTGEVEYKLASGGIGRAHISSPVRSSRIGDQSYPHPFRSAWNGKTFLSVTQAAIDRGDWWLAQTNDTRMQDIRDAAAKRTANGTSTYDGGVFAPSAGRAAG